MGTWLAVFNNDGDVCASISKRPDTTPLTALLKEQGDEIFKDCDSIALELDLEKETVKQVLRFAKKVQQAGLRGHLQHEHRHGTPRLFTAGGLLCVQPAGKPGCSSPDDYDHLSPLPCGGAGRQCTQRQHPLHGGHHGRAGCRVPAPTAKAALCPPRRWM